MAASISYVKSMVRHGACPTDAMCAVEMDKTVNLSDKTKIKEVLSLYNLERWVK